MPEIFKTSELMFTTETGMFHSACRIKVKDEVYWFGFKPIKHFAPIGWGMVDHSDRLLDVKSFATFKIEIYETDLLNILQGVCNKYKGKLYGATILDCVSFTADVARRVGLAVPSINITPYGFLLTLKIWNNKQCIKSNLPSGLFNFHR
jgi:hypothetical protein